MSSLASPPFIDIDGIFNFRDVGGFVTSQGIVRRGWIFRSAQPGGVTEQGAATLQELGITTIFDLRAKSEIEKYSSFMSVKEILGIERRSVPVLNDSDYQPEKQAMKFMNYSIGPKGYEQAYANILAHGGPTFVEVFKHLRDKPSEACLIHCTAGKDRTGVLIALILCLAGVCDDDIASEYHLTDQGLAAWKPSLAKLLMEDPALKDNLKAVENIMSAEVSNLMPVLKFIRGTYKGAEEYVKNFCNLDDEDIISIKANLLD